jgi:hypothetical protein
MDVFQRRLFVAKNPGPEAIFFDKIILAFIRIILKYDASSMLQDKKGLCGRCSSWTADLYIGCCGARSAITSLDVMLIGYNA